MIPLLDVRNLKKYFNIGSGVLHAVDNVSFTIERGKTLGVVGESGGGKTTLGRTVLHLVEPTSGKIFFNGQDISSPSKKELIKLRESMQIIFQDPFSSLDPRMTVSEAIMEPIQIQGKMSKQEMYQRALELMGTVGLAERLANSYPHELDGGRRQRIGIARALSLEPQFIVCDEPVSALDVSIQAQVINLLLDLQETHGLTYMFITHDLSVVKYISDDIMVLYMGEVVEKAPADELFQRTLHPYSKALLSAIPIPKYPNDTKRILLKGEVTSPVNPKPGCRFMPRCRYADACCCNTQKLEEVSLGHFVACCRCREIN